MLALDCISTNPDYLSSTCRELIEQLQNAGVEVHLMTESFHCLVDGLARNLQVDLEFVHANELVFDYEGMT